MKESLEALERACNISMDILAKVKRKEEDPKSACLQIAMQITSMKSILLTAKKMEEVKNG